MLNRPNIWPEHPDVNPTDIQLLYVDDEQSNLIAFEATFRRVFNITTVLSAKEALELLKKHSYHIVISDQRMPEMTGIQLFQRMKLVYPDPVRIMLTGYSDIETVVDAINKGEVYRYVTKPWNFSEVRNVILSAYEVYELRHKTRILEEKLAEAHKRIAELERVMRSV
ncbi:MAG: hypothetical protein Kow0075_02640 [Salibacteraceae bacterium]